MKQPLLLIFYHDKWNCRNRFEIIKSETLENYNADFLVSGVKVLAEGNELSLVRALEATLKRYKSRKPRGLVNT